MTFENVKKRFGARSGGVRSLFPATQLPAATAAIVILLLGLLADYQNNILYEQRQRAEVLSALNVVRAKLEGQISSNLQLVRGLVATIETEPSMPQARFSELATNLLREDSQLRLVAAAPDMVIRLIHPLAGNEKALGLDYRTQPAQRDAALRARDKGKLVLAGPLELAQGGVGLIGRFPVFTRADDGTTAFWGIVSAVVDVEQLYGQSGLDDAVRDLDIALSGVDGSGADGPQFYGPPSVADAAPVQAEVVLPDGRWIISAVPRGGWKRTADNAWAMRILIAAAGMLVVFPMAVTGRLLEERRRNVTALRSREDELRRVSRRLVLALETSRIGVWDYDIASGRLVWDERMYELYGYGPAASPSGRVEDWIDRLHPEDRAEAAAVFRRSISAGTPYLTHYRLLLPDGTVRHVRAIGTVYQDEDGVNRIVGVNWDVTEDVHRNEEIRRANVLLEARNADLERAKAAIEHTSLHDFLTGLPNRRYLDAVLEGLRNERDRALEPIALLHIDLDRFKQINDTLGHDAGDAMLIHAARVMTESLRPGEVLSRIGGDEFVIVCSLKDDPERAAELAGRIVEAMRHPVDYRGSSCRLGVSIGVATAGPSAAERDRLLMNADVALYRAKSRGRNRFEFYTDVLHAELVRTKRTGDEILAGLEAGEFEPFYQPQVDARTRRVVGAEALARWRHPVHGIVTPDRFLSIAEDLNVLATIDRIILEQALADRERWRAAGYELPRVSVNVSSRRLHDETLASGLLALALEPGTVSFELVESTYLDESDEVVSWNIDRIRDLGIELEIDDFGTGYASIVSLTKLRPNRLKIDRQLAAPVVDTPSQRRLVEAIVEIGRSLGIQTVAEGVETEAQAEALSELGCDVLQGYLFARPLSRDEMETFLRDRHRLAG